MQARFAAPIAALFASSLAARAQAPLYTVEGETFDQVGRAVALLPDIDIDGVGDFIVGAPYDDPALTGEQLGSVALYSGKTSLISKVRCLRIVDKHRNAATRRIRRLALNFTRRGVAPTLSA